MANPILVMENVETTRRIKLYRFLGVDWYYTPVAWLGMLVFIGGGIIVALIFSPPGNAIINGIFYGALAYFANTLHTIGHILGGRVVGAPMHGNLVTIMRHINLYNDTGNETRRIHLGRALGGPIMNILVGVLALIGWSSSQDHFMLFFAVIGLSVYGIFPLFPIPSLDGEVIWRELRKNA